MKNYFGIAVIPYLLMTTLGFILLKTSYLAGGIMFLLAIVPFMVAEELTCRAREREEEEKGREGETREEK